MLKLVFTAIAALFVCAAGLFAAGRLQSWPEATLVAECGMPESCAFKGEVSRDFWTGDYVVKNSIGTTVVPIDNWRSMAYSSDYKIGWKSTTAAIIGLLGSLLILTISSPKSLE